MPVRAPLHRDRPRFCPSYARVSYLYDLMDAAYDAAAIHAQSEALGHVPIIDPNFRAQHEVKSEWAQEVERMAFINMPDPDDVIYNFRFLAVRCG